MGRTIKFPFTSLVVFAGLSACSQNPLSPLVQVNSQIPNAARVSASFCTLPAGTVKSDLKFTFIIDKSGSNQTLGTQLGTDPDGTRRYNAILSFLDQAPVDPSVTYALINLTTTGYQVGPAGFTDKATFRNIIINQKFAGGCAFSASNPYVPGCPQDGGWTDYLGALQLDNTLVSNDIQAAAANKTQIVSSYYVTFLVTDGAPITNGYPGAYDYESPISIDNAVTALIALATGQYKDYVDAIQLHTLNYYNTTADPCPPTDVANQAVGTTLNDYCSGTLLQSMATLGNGNFISVSGGGQIDFTKFAVPTTQVKHSLRDVFVENENTVWWNGQLMLDSDGDGLPDLVELSLGSDPFNWDSDGNGVGDGVEYFALGKPCKDAHCLSTNAEPFASCASLVQTGLSNGRIYGDLDGDKLNDCEEKVVLRSNYTNWNTNSDWIPDWLSFKFGLSFVAGFSEAQLDPANDGVTNYLKVKTNLPIYFPSKSIINIKPYSYNLQVVSDNATQTCYQLDVTNVSNMKPDGSDSIRIYVIENASIISTNRYMRTSAKKLTGGRLSFVDSDIVLASTN